MPDHFRCRSHLADAGRRQVLAFREKNTTRGLRMFVEFQSRNLLFAALMALLIVPGCGGGGPREYLVTGSVTFDGLPVEDGEIVFLPANMGTPRAAQIVNGQFQCRLPEGEKQVQITATRESPTPAPDGLPNYESYIPAMYNTQSKLTAEVKANGDNALTFDLQSRPATP